MTRALLASLMAAAALAVAPAAALAQDAGGDQYKDPLDQGSGHHSTPSTPSTPSSPSSTASAAAPGSTASAASPATGTAAAASAQAGGPNEIPRTGFPVGFLMFAGALCLCGGLALRRAAGIAGA